jgi:hypothetical protein
MIRMFAAEFQGELCCGYIGFRKDGVRDQIVTSIYGAYGSSKDGWRAAKKDGWRVVPVHVTKERRECP